MKEFPRKFLSLRDKNAASNRSKSAPPGNSKTSRPLSAEAFLSIFKTESKQTPQPDSEAVKERAKIDEVQRHLEQLNIVNVSVDHIRDIMATKYANGDPEKTADFIDIERKAASGRIMSYDPSVRMVGAENRGAVTCYLDSLLFSMFSKLDAFECMLKNDFPPDDPRSKLVNLLRIWVNMLRTGKLIRIDVTKLIQDALADCGWQDARMLEQQDTSEAFAFLTETLQLPLLSLQVDLFHQGKKEKDDHKIVYERLLNLAVPPDPEGKGIKLEDCLEEYFNAQVDVFRDSEEVKKSFMEDKSPEAAPLLSRRNTIRLVRGEESMLSTTMTASPIEMAPSTPIFDHPVGRGDRPSSRQTSGSSCCNSQNGLPQISRQTSGLGCCNSNGLPQTSKEDNDTSGASQRTTTRHRSTSVIQRVLLDEQGRPTSSDSTMLQRAKRKGSTVVKAVTIPAWQFFRLIPWHALNSKEPQNNVDVAMNFDQRPVVGICLKRYAMTESGLPKRHNTFIDIPDSLRLPHFMLADGPTMEEDPNGLSTEYKLVLQSVVCHRGDSLQSGHYIAFARAAPKLLTDNRRHDFDPPPDYEEAQWVKFDDLEIESRVTFVDNIRQSMREEMPYLLFYQVVPMVDVACPSSESTETEPPSYNQSKSSLEIPRTGTSDGMPANLGQGLTTCYEDPTMAKISRLGQSKPPSIRLSAEVERDSRGFYDIPDVETPPSGSRRQSVSFTDSGAATSPITPDAQSPVITPVDDPTGPSNESTTGASRLSRAASRLVLGGRSRPVSQSGEGRISSTMSRLGFMRPSREPLAEPSSLNISAANLSPEMVNHAQPESPTEPEKPPQQSQRASKSKHKRVKSKEKVEKHKGDQPERECTVM